MVAIRLAFLAFLFGVALAGPPSDSDPDVVHSFLSDSTAIPTSNLKRQRRITLGDILPSAKRSGQANPLDVPEPETFPNTPDAKHSVEERPLSIPPTDHIFKAIKFPHSVSNYWYHYHNQARHDSNEARKASDMAINNWKKLAKMVPAKDGYRDIIDAHEENSRRFAKATKDHKKAMHLNLDSEDAKSVTKSANQSAYRTQLLIDRIKNVRNGHPSDISPTSQETRFL